jgi:hypothetical protein
MGLDRVPSFHQDGDHLLLGAAREHHVKTGLFHVLESAES